MIHEIDIYLKKKHIPIHIEHLDVTEEDITKLAIEKYLDTHSVLPEEIDRLEARIAETIHSS